MSDYYVLLLCICYEAPCHVLSGGSDPVPSTVFYSILIYSHLRLWSYIVVSKLISSAGTHNAVIGQHLVFTTKVTLGMLLLDEFMLPYSCYTTLYFERARVI